MPNRRILESWLKSITPYPYTPSELTDALMNLGIEVESFDDRFSKLDGFVVGEVLDCQKHPNADKLSVCTVTTGGDPVTVVCGAPNVAAGQKIAFAPVGTHVATAGFTIERRKIRGVESQGMICSESELGLGDSHDGILVLPEDAPVGEPLGKLLGDVIYEIEITPNRADCLSHLGIAREVAALTGEDVHLPTPDLIESGGRAADAVTIEIEDAELCPRYAARVVRGVTVGPSPEWLQETIRRLGLRPRNNIVDITNYVLFECGQPLHAFDLDQIGGSRIVVRPVAGGEKFTTLDGKEHELPEKALMICDAEKPIAIAGVMGGENSEVSETTVNVLIESAHFSATSIRRTAKKLGVATDASYRFERGTDINATIYAANRAAELIAQLAGGDVLEGIVDVYPNPRAPLVVELRPSRATSIIGVDIPIDRQLELLRRLGFEAHRAGEESIMATVPSYRVDIFGEIDLIEEIARLNGYDEIPMLPRADFQFQTAVQPMQRLIETSRAFFVDSGFMELAVPYFTDPETATQYGKPVELRNALGRDFSMLRTSLAPSIGKVIALNERYSRPDMRIFEIGRAFRRGRIDQGAIPGVVEMTELAVAMSGAAEPTAWDTPKRPADLHDLRGMLDRYFTRIGVRGVSYRRVDEAMWGLAAPALSIHVGDAEVGRIGEFDTWIVDRHKIAGTPVVALVDLERLLPHAFAKNVYRAPSKFPTVSRDISLLVDAAVSNDEMERTIRSSGGELLTGVRLFDLYQGKGVENGKKSVAYALSFTSYERTLEEKEIESAVAAIVTALGNAHGAVLRM